MSEQLRPCPFCGHTRDLDTFEAGEVDEAVACPNCWAWGPVVYEGAVEDMTAEARKRWNERPVEDALLAACEAARRAITSLPVDALGEAEFDVTLPSGECGRQRYPIRDELLDRLGAAIAKAKGKDV